MRNNDCARPARPGHLRGRSAPDAGSPCTAEGDAAPPGTIRQGGTRGAAPGRRRGRRGGRPGGAGSGRAGEAPSSPAPPRRRRRSGSGRRSAAGGGALPRGMALAPAPAGPPPGGTSAGEMERYYCLLRAAALLEAAAAGESRGAGIGSPKDCGCPGGGGAQLRGAARCRPLPRGISARGAARAPCGLGAVPAAGRVYLWSCAHVLNGDRLNAAGSIPGGHREEPTGGNFSRTESVSSAAGCGRGAAGAELRLSGKAPVGSAQADTGTLGFLVLWATLPVLSGFIPFKERLCYSVLLTSICYWNALLQMNLK